jgi:UDP-N-acetyl-D-mannosaminuronic acid transferase (WecB/TagA/CpsF family)
MKSQLKNGVLAPETCSNSEIPIWVSEMGLVWLYDLLSSFTQNKAARLI